MHCLFFWIWGQTPTQAFILALASGELLIGTTPALQHHRMRVKTFWREIALMQFCSHHVRMAMMRSGRPFGCRRSCDRIYWRHSKCSLMAAMSGGSSKSTIHFKFSQNLLFRIHPLILVLGSMCGKINWSVQCNACDYDNPELEGRGAKRRGG